MSEQDNEPERRHQNRRSEDRLHERVAALEVTTKEIQAVQLEDSKQLDRIEGQAKTNYKATADLIEAFEALKGAWKVLSWIGRLAKPIGTVATGGLAIAAAWHAFKLWIKAS